MRPSKIAPAALAVLVETFKPVARLCVAASEADNAALDLLARAIDTAQQWRGDTRELTRQDGHATLGRLRGMLETAPNLDPVARNVLLTHAHAVALFLRCDYRGAFQRAHVAAVAADQTLAERG